MNARRTVSPPDVVRLFAPAKINWTLEVIGRRPDGYHEIDTVMQAVSLRDELELKRMSRPLFRITCDDPRVPRDASNLVHRAWRLMREARPRDVGGLSVKLKKRVPTGAGLGGGSSDAAAALVGINHAYRLGLGRSDMIEFAAELGGDVAFFLLGGAARCGGRGERVEPIRCRLPAIHLVIAFPGFESGTAKAYASLDPRYFGDRRSSNRAARALVQANPSALLSALSNTFDLVLPKSEKRYVRIKTAMESAGLCRPMLSGSGSSCFGMARNAALARRAAQILAGEFSQVFVVRTIRSGARRVHGQGSS